MDTHLIRPDQNLSQHVVMLAWRFVQRWDLFAKQMDDGRYICVHKPLTLKHLLAHLEGSLTLGTYMVDQESKTRMMALDADDDQGFERLGTLAKTLAEKDIPSYLEKSRRGGHLWFFFSKVIPGYQVREFGSGILAHHQFQDVELYPKQDKLADGPGSLVRMPFGVHRKTGKRYGFFTPDGSPLAATVREQIEILSEPQTVPDALFTEYRAKSPQPMQKSHPERQDIHPDIVVRIKNKIKALDFISLYVDLKPAGRGAVGLCPFHDDQVTSFSVNDQENYWNCFAGCGGGSIIDFWMKWNNRSFADAVKELEKMLL